MTDPAATLARIFLLADAASGREVLAALPTLTITGALELGIIESAPAAGTYRALLDLRPFAVIDRDGATEWWIVSDLSELALGTALPPEHVLGVGGASLTLASLIPTHLVDRVLDLGTGCAIQSLHAARHARHVVATDLSTRALERAGLTLQLNGVHAQLRQGDLFAPVVGERFDRIVSNPPFVITPRVDGIPVYEYRDGGRVGDALIEEVVRGLANHLVDGGTAHLLGNWEYRDELGGNGLARVRSWVQESGLDAWIVERERQSPAEYAATWIRDGGTRVGTPSYDRLAQAWLDDFAARGVTAVGFGYLLVRSPTATSAPLLRTEVLTTALGDAPSGMGDHLVACVRAHDVIGVLTDDALCRQRLVVARDVTEERHYWPGEENPTVIRLRQGGGFGRSIDADTALAGLVGACDGDLTVSQIIAALADLLEVDEATVLADLVPRVRELIVTGMLTLSTER